MGCKKLEPFDFPPQLEVIGEKAFIDTDQMGIIDLRNTKVNKIGMFAFGCEAEKTIYLPVTVTAQSVSAIDRIFAKVEVPTAHRYIQSDVHGNMYSRGAILLSNMVSEHILIRRGVERIANECFAESKLVSLTIPASVTVICESAFISCESLEIVRFAKDSRLKEIENEAFCMCDSIRKISFPKSLRILRSQSFEFC